MFFIFFSGMTAPSRPGPPHCLGFTISLRRTKLGRTALDEWSARCRDICLKTQQTSMPPAAFEPAIPASERPQPLSLDGAATGIAFHSYYLLTYSMVQSPSWEANWFEASQEIPHISRNPKVRYRTHKRPPPVSILGQPNLVHIPTSHFLEIHPNTDPSTPRSPQWSLSLRFPHQDPIHPPLLTHTRHMSSPSHSSRF